MISERQAWIVVRIKPNQDKIALKNLEQQDFKIFQPLTKTTTRFHNKFKETMKPVFPGYVFVLVNFAEKRWQKINNTVGVSQIIVFGNEIPFVKYEIIEELKNSYLRNSSHQQTDLISIGEKVKITNGPFAQLFGRIEKVNPNQRIWLLLDILGKQTRVSINRLNLITLQ